MAGQASGLACQALLVIGMTHDEMHQPTFATIITAYTATMVACRNGGDGHDGEYDYQFACHICRWLTRYQAVIVINCH